jgi:Ca2+-binding RTX toxin-like protein
MSTSFGLQKLLHLLGGKSNPRTRAPRRQRSVRLEQLESRFALSAAPVAVNDPDGPDPISITINAQDVQLNVALNDLDDATPQTSLTVIEAIGPAHGTLVPDPINSYAFLYTPTPGYTGPDSFTYRVRDSDPQLSTNTATVSLFVYPRAFAGLNHSLAEGGTLSLSSEANTEFNIPGSIGHGELTYTWAIDPNIGNSFPTSLSPTIFDDFPTVHTANPTLTWDDLADWGITNGNIENAVIALKVVDESGNSDTDFTRLSVGNVNPELTSFTITSLGCGSDVTLNATILEANPNDQLEVFIDWDFLNFTDTEENLGAPNLVSSGPSGSSYSITVALHHYATPGFKLPVLRVVADGADNGSEPDFDANNLGLITNGVVNPDFDPEFPFFINVGAGGGSPTVSIDGAPANSPEGTPINLTSTLTCGCGECSDYVWTLFKDGSLTPFATGTAANFSFTPDDNGSYVVNVSVEEGAATDSETITVTNVVPTAALTGPGAGIPTQVLLFTAIADDSSSVDAASLDFSIDWGDGDSNSDLLFHKYTLVGTYIVTLTVEDKDGGSITTSDHTVVIGSSVSDPAGNQYSMDAAGNLSVTAVDNVDNTIHVFVGSLNVDIDGNLTTFDPVPPSLTINGGPGNDTITVDPDVTAPVTISGGAGDDTIIGGSGHDTLSGGAGADILVGGDGNDLLTGGSGRDILIGGDGKDALHGKAEDDILISGILTFSDLGAALSAIQAEWLSSHSFAIRTANIEGWGPNPIGAGYRLTSSTVLDDNDKDTLTGDQGSDWFFANLWLDCGEDAAQKDQIVDLSLFELMFANDLDFED